MTQPTEPTRKTVQPNRRQWRRLTRAADAAAFRRDAEKVSADMAQRLKEDDDG